MKRNDQYPWPVPDQLVTELREALDERDRLRTRQSELLRTAKPDNPDRPVIAAAIKAAEERVRDVIYSTPEYAWMIGLRRIPRGQWQRRERVADTLRDHNRARFVQAQAARFAAENGHEPIGIDIDASRRPDFGWGRWQHRPQECFSGAALCRGTGYLPPVGVHPDVIEARCIRAGSVMDHPEFYYAVRNGKRRPEPVAIVAHLYHGNDPAATLEAAERWAASVGLIVHTHPDPHGSWYWPGRCLVVCYTNPNVEHVNWPTPVPPTDWAPSGAPMRRVIGDALFGVFEWANGDPEQSAPHAEPMEHER